MPRSENFKQPSQGGKNVGIKNQNSLNNKNKKDVFEDSNNRAARSAKAKKEKSKV